MRHCEICKQPIDADRAEAIRQTRLCTEHGREIQKYGGEFIMSSTQEKTSKEGSLKKNYGGISTQLRRNERAVAQLREAYERAKEEGSRSAG
ncbi:MAG: hypothetical protein ACKVP0_19580 [Pirellulaceae bacterium]